MNKKKITLSVVLCMALTLQMFSMGLAKEKVKSVNTNYYDTIITSWKTGYYKTTALWNYSGGKLLNQKDLSLSYKTPIGYVTNSTKTKWSWYDVGYGGTGYGKSEWEIMIGINTKWVSIGVDKQKDWHAIKVYSDGDYEKKY
ncbi:MAG: hypothetical protein E7270_10990 [Lachnospiraceae bacterium]|nr:hypothetical protein [Lachnospiraceae bacterium]